MSGLADFQVIVIAAAAHGRQKGHFVAIGEFRRRVGKLLIPRHYDAARKIAEGAESAPHRRSKTECRSVPSGNSASSRDIPAMSFNIPKNSTRARMVCR